MLAAQAPTRAQPLGGDETDLVPADGGGAVREVVGVRLVEDLGEDFESATGEAVEIVQEERSVPSEPQLARVAPAAGEPSWGEVRSRRTQGRCAGLGRWQGDSPVGGGDLLGCKALRRWQDAGEGAGVERLARGTGAGQEDRVSTYRGDPQGLLGGVVPEHLGPVGQGRSRHVLARQSVTLRHHAFLLRRPVRRSFAPAARPWAAASWRLASSRKRRWKNRARPWNSATRR